jgi:hypothetical protein
MKGNHNYITFLFLLLLFSLQGFGQSNKENQLETYSQFRTQKIELRDSLYILHTIKEWSKKNWYTFEDYSKMYKMSNDQVEYFLGAIFYSPDRTRIIVWIGNRKPNAETIDIYNKEKKEVNKLCPNGIDTIFSMTALIGIREHKNQSWKLYPFNQQQATCYETKEEVINILGQYYFEKMKDHEMYRMIQKGDRKGYLELEKYQYNLQDKDFWEKCWLWQRDKVGSYNLYPFQIKGYDYIGDKCTQKCAEPYNPPQVHYPEEILRLYK